MCTPPRSVPHHPLPPLLLLKSPAQYDFAALTLNVTSLIRRPIPRPAPEAGAADEAALKVRPREGEGRRQGRACGRCSSAGLPPLPLCPHPHPPNSPPLGRPCWQALAGVSGKEAEREILTYLADPLAALKARAARQPPLRAFGGLQGRAGAAAGCSPLSGPAPRNLRRSPSKKEKKLDRKEETKQQAPLCNPHARSWSP